MSDMLIDRSTGTQLAAYSRDTVGAYQLLQQSGFTPFKQRSPLSSALNEVFGEFSRRTGIDSDPRRLEDDFLERNPGIRRSLNPYDALQQAFAAKTTSGETAPIVSFLNGKVDEYIGSQGAMRTSASDARKSAAGRTAAATADGQRIKNDFYNGYAQLNRLLSYFQQPPGGLVNLLA